MKKEIDQLEQGMLTVIYIIQMNYMYVMSFDDNIHVFPQHLLSFLQLSGVRINYFCTGHYWCSFG